MFVEFKLFGLKVELFVAGKRGLELRDAMVESNRNTDRRVARLELCQQLDEAEAELEELRIKLASKKPAKKARVVKSKSR